MSGAAEPPAIDAPPLERSISLYRVALPATQEQQPYRKPHAKENWAENRRGLKNTEEQMLSFKAYGVILCAAKYLGKS
jgi:hypothetical protein